MDYFSANRYVLSIIGFFSFLCLVFFFFISPPADFPAGTIVKIEQGSTLRSVSLIFKNDHIIRSRIAFEFFVILFGREKHVVEADYYFENKLPVYEIARRVSRGEHHMAPVVATIPEGFNRNQIAEVFASKLMNFNKDRFLSATKGLEGYLFPDTYFFLNTDDDATVLSSMKDNFSKKIATVYSDIMSSHKIEREIIIMASLIEAEAKGDADRGFISGILWKRLSIGMPLQVDSAPETYKTKGLPKNPIGNPGLRAIMAAIYPQKSPYLYYLHDKNGNIHYARTFAEHVQNKFKYLQ